MDSVQTVLSQNVQESKLAHAYLIQGNNITQLFDFGLKLAADILKTPRLDPAKGHPDLFVLRPANKMRQISVEITRELIRNIQHTPIAGDKKVALIVEADRMHISAANAFLKTLEEPPANTTLLLLSIRPHKILTTIKSRCFKVRLPAEFAQIDHLLWKEWKNSYMTWLEKIQKKPSGSSETADYLMHLYGLIASFSHALEVMTDEALKNKKSEILETWTDEETTAFETGITKGIRETLFREMADFTRDFVFKHKLFEGNNYDNNSNTYQKTNVLKLSEVVKILEEACGLLEVNFNENNALEYFLLTSIRIWPQ